jgi:signal transduction histidine kinase
MVGFSHFPRVQSDLVPYYVGIRGYHFLSFLTLTIYCWRNDFDDLTGAICSLNLVIYVISMMWFMPLYEIAYFEMAIGAAFLKFKRPWIHPLIFGMGLCGMLFTYWLQDHLKWTLPPIERSDWIFSIIIIFLLAWAIQKFAIRAQQKENDRLLKFSIIGKETARLTHDLKGMLSSPMLILESFRDKSIMLPPDFYEKQMSYLMSDMDKVRDSLVGINRLVNFADKNEEFDINEVFVTALRILERRLQNVNVKIPTARRIRGNADVLLSVFFNLLLNSIEAFEKNLIEIREIELYWEKNVLVIKDNAGGTTAPDFISLKTGGGLGLPMVRGDLQKMSAEFSISSNGTFTFAKICFSQKSTVVD